MIKNALIAGAVGAALVASVAVAQNSSTTTSASGSSMPHNGATPGDAAADSATSADTGMRSDTTSTRSNMRSPVSGSGMQSGADAAPTGSDMSGANDAGYQAAGERG